MAKIALYDAVSPYCEDLTICLAQRKEVEICSLAFVRKCRDKTEGHMCCTDTHPQENSGQRRTGVVIKRALAVRLPAG